MACARRLFFERSFKRRIVTVDVFEEVHFAVFSNDGCPVENPHRNGFFQVHAQCRFADHGRSDALLASFRITAKNPNSQCDGIFDTKASDDATLLVLAVK
jgi:hypothetical protein